MALVVGIDPGLKGALAVYDTDAQKLVTVIDMPVMELVINRKKRTRFDVVALYNWLDLQKMCDVQLVMLEEVGGRPKQSAGGGFILGYGCGLIYMACVATRLPIETISPQVWKKMMRLPGKTQSVERISKEGKKEKIREADSEANMKIVQRAEELMPESRDMLRGPKGGLRVDRAEAACLAKYAGDYVLTRERVHHAKFDWDMYAKKVELGT